MDEIALPEIFKSDVREAEIILFEFTRTIFCLNHKNHMEKIAILYMIRTLKSDITQITDVQASVKATNNFLLCGDGVDGDGAIHRVAGPDF